MFVYGQKANEFSFSLGSAIPLGNFKKKDVNSTNSGYAKKGYNIEFSYSRNMVRQIKLELSLLGISNGMDNEPVINQFVSSYPSNTYAKIHGRAWNSTSLLVGISKDIQLDNKRISIEPKIQLGYSHTIRPELFISTRNDDYTIPPGESESYASSLGFLFGLNNNYTFNDIIGVFVSVEYFMTSPEFTYMHYPPSDKNSSSTPEKIVINQDIQVILLNGGLSISF